MGHIATIYAILAITIVLLLMSGGFLPSELSLELIFKFRHLSDVPFFSFNCLVGTRYYMCLKIIYPGNSSMQDITTKFTTARCIVSIAGWRADRTKQPAIPTTLAKAVEALALSTT